MSPRPNFCYPILVTESTNYQTSEDDQEITIPADKRTHIDSILFSRDTANIIAKEYFIRQHCESDEDANEDHFGNPTPRAKRWGIWVPSNTSRCDIRDVGKCCRIEVILGEGSDRREILVEVLKEEIPDANGPLAREDKDPDV